MVEKTLNKGSSLLYYQKERDLKMTQIRYYTPEGLKKLKEELDHLMSVERPSISAQIAEARDKGDLSENAEYDAAKNAQGMLEMRISKLQEVIRNARLIDETKLDSDKVLILSTVKVQNLKNQQIMQYTLVPENEADIKKGKISVSSPIARAMIGKYEGDPIDVQAPGGVKSYEVLAVRYE